MGLFDGIKTNAIAAVVNGALNYLEKDPETNIPKLLDMVDKYSPDGWYETQRAYMRKFLVEEKGNWWDLALKFYDLDPGVRKSFFRNFITNASLKGTAKQNETVKKHGCNAPWAILMDPTSACNLHCTGCWAAQYGNRLNLSYDDMNSIIEQANKLGCYMFIYTGGEPTVRKDDIFKLCEAHPDSEFLAFTNGTLIDEKFCENMLRVKNFVPAISVEGFEETNDARRGQGVYDKVMHAMDLLKQNHLPFGISVCYTRANMETVTSDKFLDWICDKGALFAWYFHFMPVGKSANVDLMPTPEQRLQMVERFKHFRATKPIFTLDFQNDGMHVGGCIAGGRRYLHINAKGDAEPCVFIHYSNVNIHDHSLLEVLRSPLFQAYHDNQPFNENHYRPCPMLENPERLRDLVHKTGAVNTDYQDQEPVDELCAKTKPYADTWKPVADQMWAEYKPSWGEEHKAEVAAEKEAAEEALERKPDDPTLYHEEPETANA